VRSLYVHDPDGLALEFTVEPPDAAAIRERQARTAHATLERFLAGDHTVNNELRHARTAPR
jgi:hypothetical protein